MPMSLMMATGGLPVGPPAPRFRIGQFPGALLGRGDRFTLIINALPHTRWEIHAVGPGTITHAAVEDAVNRLIEPLIDPGDFLALTGSTGTLEWDCQQNTLASGNIQINLIPDNNVSTAGMAELLAAVRYRVGQVYDQAYGQAGVVPLSQVRGRPPHRVRQSPSDTALELLRRMLNKEQRAMMDANGYFQIKGSAGHAYRIHTNVGYSGNIFLMSKEGAHGAEFCCHPDRMMGRGLNGIVGRLPDADALIAQKLMIETDEIRFLRTTVLNSGSMPDIPGFEHVEQLDELRCICKLCNRSRSHRGWEW